MDSSGVRVRPERLREDVEALAQFGEQPGGGILRTALSDADLEARRWFKGRMEEAGLRVREDAAANIIGRVEPDSGPRRRPLRGRWGRTSMRSPTAESSTGPSESALAWRLSGPSGKAGSRSRAPWSSWSSRMRREGISPGPSEAGPCSIFWPRGRYSNPRPPTIRP